MTRKEKLYRVMRAYWNGDDVNEVMESLAITRRDLRGTPSEASLINAYIRCAYETDPVHVTFLALALDMETDTE